jgi:DNA-binding NarL/FixJ family response regulator
MIRVFLADDHAIVRDGLRKHIDEEPDMRVVGESRDGADVIQRAGTEIWDVLVLDLSLPTLSGLEVLRKLHHMNPRLAIIVLSMYPEDQHGPRILREGAVAYLSKGRSVSEILDAIRRAAGGLHYVTPEVAKGLLPDRLTKAPHESLSRREHEIFMMVAQGKTPSDIALELELGPSTVSTYIARIREKLSARTNGEIVQYAYRLRLTGE